MDRDPLISVVIPTYNRAALLVPAIQSALAQTYPHIEILVIDDGSTDETHEAVKDLIERTSSQGGAAKQIRYIYQTNQGQSSARNRGIAEAQGDWIAFLDSDDVWLPIKLELQVRALKQFEECGACYSDARLVDTSGMNTTAFGLSGRHYGDIMGVVPDETLQLAKTFGGSWIQTLVVRRDLAKQIGGFDRDIRFAEDHDFLFRLSLVTSYCYANSPLAIIERTCIATDPVARARAWDSLEFQLDARQLMHEKWLRLATSFPRPVQTEIKRSLRRIHSSRANLHLQRGEYSLARDSLSKAIGYEFTHNLAAKWMLARLTPQLARRVTKDRYQHAA